MEDFVPLENTTPIPTIHVVSDSVGLTAQTIARAAAAQFGIANPAIETISKVRTIDEIVNAIDHHRALHETRCGEGPLLVFYTLVDLDLAQEFARYATETPDIVAVDILTPAIEAIEEVSGLEPAHEAGRLRAADQNYFRRIAAMEFTIDHDDGRNPQDLAQADIVLIGVSRTSKTPLSIYLSQMGYRVANVPLDPQTEPPHEIYDVEPSRLFGLMTTPEVLVGIRKRRIGNAAGVAKNYAAPEYVYQDLESARALMRKLGCLVIHTEHRAVEETAQEIIRYYEQLHPQIHER